MLKVSQIGAENKDPLSDEQVLALLMLVRAYDGYRKSIAIYPNLEQRIDGEKNAPTVKTQGLKAVLTALGKLPNLVVEAEGTDKAPSFFSTKKNWDELALDALNVLYNLPFGIAESRFRVVQRRICDLVLPGESAPVAIIN